MNIMTSDASAFDKGKQLGVYSIALGKEMYEYTNTKVKNIISTGWNSIKKDFDETNENIVEMYTTGVGGLNFKPSWSLYTSGVKALFNKDSALYDEESTKKTQEMLKEVATDVLKTGASTIGNIIMSGIKGLAKVGENIEDGGATLFAWYENNLAKLYGLLGWEDVQKVAGTWANDAIEFVEDERVENSYTYLYNKTFLKNVNKKSLLNINGIPLNLLSGITYYVPITVVEGILPGSGVVTNFLAGTGKTSQELLGEDKLTTKKGIKEAYKNGKVSKEMYEQYVAIWNMSEDEFYNLNLEYVRGNITLEDYNALKKIYDMPDKWEPTKNIDKIATVSAVGGVWEAAQWKVGIDLNGLKTLCGSKALASGVRVLTDANFNALDTLARSVLSSFALNVNVGDAFEQKGGIKALKSDYLVGLLGSAFGEVKEFISSKMIIENLNLEDIELKLYSRDRETSVEGSGFTVEEQEMLISAFSKALFKNGEFLRAWEVAKQVTKDIKNGMFPDWTREKFMDILTDYDLKYLESHSGTSEIFSIYGNTPLQNKIINGYLSEADKVFAENAKISGGYGANQGSIRLNYYYLTPDGRKIIAGSEDYKTEIALGTELKIVKTPEFDKLTNFIQNRYKNTSYEMTCQILERMNVDAGICYCADAVNSLMPVNINNPAKHEIDTNGIPLYKDGMLNFDELLVDYFIYYNTQGVPTSNPEKFKINLIEQKEDGSLVVNESGVSESTDRYSTYFGHTNDIARKNGYFERNGSSTRYSETEYTLMGRDKNGNIHYMHSMEEIPYKEIEEALNSPNKTVSLSVMSVKPSENEAAGIHILIRT